MESSYSLNEFEAFRAMYKFLEGVYEWSKSDAIGGLLGELNIVSDGKPIDPANWNDWLKCVEEVVSAREQDLSRRDKTG